MAILKRLVVVTFVFSFAWIPPTALAEGPEQIQLPGPSMGTVTFPHALHQTHEKNCETCHHKGVERGACKNCHELTKSSPQGRDFFHAICRDCHKKKGGPTQCTGCHTR